MGTAEPNELHPSITQKHHGVKPVNCLGRATVVAPCSRTDRGLRPILNTTTVRPSPRRTANSSSKEVLRAHGAKARLTSAKARRPLLLACGEALAALEASAIHPKKETKGRCLLLACGGRSSKKTLDLPPVPSLGAATWRNVGATQNPSTPPGGDSNPPARRTSYAPRCAARRDTTLMGRTGSTPGRRMVRMWATKVATPPQRNMDMDLSKKQLVEEKGSSKGLLSSGVRFDDGRREAALLQID